MKLTQINSINFNARIIDSHFHVGHFSEGSGINDYTVDAENFLKRINYTNDHAKSTHYKNLISQGKFTEADSFSRLHNFDVLDQIVVSNLDCMANISTNKTSVKFHSDEMTGNKKLLEIADNLEKLVIANDNPIDKVFAAPKVKLLITCQPSYGSAENIEKLLAENPEKFIGLKFHPEQLKLAADDAAYDAYMEVAKKHKLPCLFHSDRTHTNHYPDGGIGLKSEFARPEQIAKLAERHKDVPIVMGHWGGDGSDNIKEVTNLIIKSVKEENSKLYADFSWVDCNDANKPNLRAALKELVEANAIDRALFGSDAPLGRFGDKNTENAVNSYKQMVYDIKRAIKQEFPDKGEDIIQKIFHDNTEKLYSLADNSDITSELKKTSSSKSKWIIGTGILAIGAITGYCIHKKKANSDPNKINKTI